MSATPRSHTGNQIEPRPGRWRQLAIWLWPLLALVAVAVLLVTVPIYVQDADGLISETTVDAPDWLVIAVTTPGTLFSFLTAAISLGLSFLLYWRRRGERMALFLAYMFLYYGIIMAGPVEHLAKIVDLGYAVIAAQPLLVIFLTPLMFTFPDGRFAPSWSRWLVILSVLAIPAMIVLSIDLETGNRPFGLWYDYLMVVAISGIFLYGFVAQYRRYRHISSPQQRLQTKWVIYGLGLWFLLVFLSSIQYYSVRSLPEGSPVPLWFLLSNMLWWVGLSILPVVFTVAVLRYRLYDINLIIRRTLTYGLLTALLVALYILGVLLLQSLFRAVTGQESPLAIIISTLTIAALFNPLRGRLQEVIDRRFFRHKYDAGQTLARFARTTRDEVDVEVVTGELVRVVQETMQPEHVQIWLRPVYGEDKP